MKNLKPHYFSRDFRISLAAIAFHLFFSFVVTPLISYFISRKLDWEMIVAMSETMFILLAAPILFVTFNLFNIPVIPKEVMVAAIHKAFGASAIIENLNYKRPFQEDMGDFFVYLASSSIHLKVMKGMDTRVFEDFLIFGGGYTLELYKNKAIGTETSKELTKLIKASIPYYKYY